MSTTSPNPPRTASVPWGVALAAVSLLTVGGGAIIWTHRDSPPPTTPQSGTEVRGIRRQLPLPSPADGVPLPPGLQNTSSLYSISFTQENGTRVVKIRVVADGDELIVDAQTGRLLETRPSRPTAPPPMGRFVAPFSPMT
jgi:hypothetical protein